MLASRIAIIGALFFFANIRSTQDVGFLQREYPGMVALLQFTEHDSIYRP